MDVPDELIVSTSAMLPVLKSAVLIAAAVSSTTKVSMPPAVVLVRAFTSETLPVTVKVPVPSVIVFVPSSEASRLSASVDVPALIVSTFAMLPVLKSAVLIAAAVSVTTRVL